MDKKFTLSPLFIAGMLATSTAMAAPVDDVTMEVIDARSVKASEVLNEIELPERYEARERNM
jgi:hypothetical protein